MLLEMKGICKSYGMEHLKVPVLFDVDLQVEEEEYISIMGPSGSGKSTLMNIIGCLDRASAGTYLLENEDVSRLSESQLSELRLRKIGFVFQTFHLLPRETALENVMLPLIYAGVDRQERRRRAAEALEKVGLADRLDFLPSQLSGGQKQRVAIARAMINDPRLLLADEPTGALDQSSGKQIMDLFRRLNREGTTVIMITHDADVAAHSDRILKIVDGKLYGGLLEDNRQVNAHEE